MKETKKKRVPIRHRKVPNQHKEAVAVVAVGPLMVILIVMFVIGINITASFLRARPDLLKPANPAVRTQSVLSAVVLSSRYSEGSQIYQPLPGYRYVVLKVAVSHNLSNAQWLSPVLQSYVVDQYGTKYDLSPVESDQPFDAKLYQPGESAVGEVSYMIPNSPLDLEWCYELSEQSIKSCSPIQE